MRLFQSSINKYQDRKMNKLIMSRRAAFGIKRDIMNFLYMGDPLSPSEQIIQASIHTGVPSLKTNIVKGVPSTYQITKLSPGITILTESVSIPSNVNLGIFLNVGSRDESSENSGVNLLLKNTYLKTALNTNQTVNYGVAQMAGGQFESDFNRQSTFYRANCLSHDVIDVFSMMADCAFEPKNFVSSNVGAHKNQKSHQLDASLGGNESFNDVIYSTAFGKGGLGNKLYGNKTNISNLNAFVVQNFQNTYLTPQRVVIGATGIQNHQQFVDLVNEKMFSTQLQPKNTPRSQSFYIGGQVRNITESSSIHIVVAFEGSNHQNAIPLLIAQQILGNNRKSGRIQRNILCKNAFIDGAQSFCANYQETGIFGLKLSGSASHAQQVITVAAKELSNLKNVSAAEVDLAKQSLKSRIQIEHTSSWRRLEDKIKVQFYLGSVQTCFHSSIDSVSVSDVQNAISKSLKTKLTLVVQGGEANRLPSYDNLSKLFQ